MICAAQHKSFVFLWHDKSFSDQISNLVLSEY
jgi:hypothetical protein